MTPKPNPEFGFGFGAHGTLPNPEPEALNLWRREESVQKDSDPKATWSGNIRWPW